MQIDLLPADVQRLADRATAHGFAKVDDFVSEVLTKVASLSDEATVFVPLDQDQLANSEETIGRGEADLANGRVQDMRDGMAKLGADRGLSLGE